jgi:DeoR/GlpR family transcriptional regulator of sugar metabolism
VFRNERHEKILELVERDGRVQTAELAESFGVSEDSIRKDLQLLDAKHLVRRVYGGAIRLSDGPSHVVLSRVDDHRAQKQEIARKALGLVENDMTVFLDISTTNLFLADLIAASDLRCIVVSNMVDIVKRAAAGRNVEVQCPGGRMNLELSGLVGASCARALSRLRPDLAFMGTLEVSVETDSVSTFDSEDGQVKQTVLERAERSYVVADSNKFGARGSYAYARLSDFTGLISDGEKPAYLERVRRLGIDVL